LRTEEDRALLSRELREILGALDVVVVADEVHPAIAVEEHRLRPDVLGEILRLSDSVRRGDAKLGIERSDLVGITSEDPAVLGAYVRSLLAGADGELASRVLEEPTKS
jgi:hypothetical protein